MSDPLAAADPPKIAAHVSLLVGVDVLPVWFEHGWRTAATGHIGGLIRIWKPVLTLRERD